MILVIRTNYRNFAEHNTDNNSRYCVIYLAVCLTNITRSWKAVICSAFNSGRNDIPEYKTLHDHLCIIKILKRIWKRPTCHQVDSFLNVNTFSICIW